MLQQVTREKMQPYQEQRNLNPTENGAGAMKRGTKNTVLEFQDVLLYNYEPLNSYLTPSLKL